MICDDPGRPDRRALGPLGDLQDPGHLTGLPEGLPAEPRLKSPAGALQGQELLAEGQGQHRLPRADAAARPRHAPLSLQALRPGAPSCAAEPGLDKKSPAGGDRRARAGQGRVDRHVREVEFRARPTEAPRPAPGRPSTVRPGRLAACSARRRPISCWLLSRGYAHRQLAEAGRRSLRPGGPAADRRVAVSPAATPRPPRRQPAPGRPPRPSPAAPSGWTATTC